MKAVVDFGDPESFVESVCDRLVEMGVVIRAPKRVEPYSVAEVAEMAGVSQTTVSRLAQQGVLKKVAHLSGRVLLTAESVESWLRGDQG